MNQTEIYGFLNKQINPICPAYNDHYPEKDKKVFPYVEIKLPNINQANEYADNNQFELDVWDDKGVNINEIEGIADSINKKINKAIYNDDHKLIIVNKNNPYRLTIPDQEIGIQRRQLRYVLKVYDKQQ